MELHLQVGWGMMSMSTDLLKHWKTGAVITSPRDIQPPSLVPFAKRITKAGGEPLLDPQFYLPHADHERLTSHPFWPSSYATSTFWTSKQVEQLVYDIFKQNKAMGSRQVLLPGLFAHAVDDQWLRSQEQVQKIAEKANEYKGALFATVALSHDAVTDINQIADLIERSSSWKTHGIYLVCEHPNGEYLVTAPNWLSNVLDLVAGLRLQGKAVILGYTSHQSLIAGCAAATAIASGNYMNVRAFPKDKFSIPDEDKIARKGLWYYCPTTLSEYKLSYLDTAQQQKILGKLKPSVRYENPYSSMLFTGVQPTLTGFDEPLAFKHYLHCLRCQCLESVKDSFDGTVEHHLGVLENAEKLLKDLQASGITAQHRSFMETIDASRAAIATLKTTRGAMLRRKWNRLIA